MNKRTVKLRELMNTVDMVKPSTTHVKFKGENYIKVTNIRYIIYSYDIFDIDTYAYEDMNIFKHLSDMTEHLSTLTTKFASVECNVQTLKHKGWFIDECVLHLKKLYINKKVLWWRNKIICIE